MSTLKPAHTLTTTELVALLETANEAYRAGTPIMSDAAYDSTYVSELVARDPGHPFLNRPEAEPDFGTGKVRHRSALLSTDKAYTANEIKAFVRRVQKAGQAIGITTNDLRFRLTPKLDGIAGSYVDGKLATRGSGLMGNDITHMLKLGTIALGGTDTGPGEVVLDKEYWNANLVDVFAYPRNVIAGIASADTLNEHAKEALEAGAVRFVPFARLNHKEVDAETLVGQLETLCSELEAGAGYETDGVVIEVTHVGLKSHLGSTSHHHRWQIAKKTVGTTAEATVERLTWNGSRTGRITPVIIIEPTHLSGATITHVTGHHAGNVRNLNIGAGARITITRSGSVIPTLIGMVSEGEPVTLPDNCPTCEGGVTWENDFLICTNELCEARMESRLGHFFEIIDNVDLFGPKTIETLVASGLTELPAIYNMTSADLVTMGFGPKQSQNLVDQLKRSRSESVENWRFLAAFGIHHLGRGDSRRLLKTFTLEALEGITASQIQTIAGFGPVTAPKIAAQINELWPLIRQMLDFGFNLKADEAPTTAASALAGKSIVFTGTLSLSREEMQETARMVGANVQSSVSKSTDILVAGENVGAKKIEAAQAKGVQILCEAEYEALCAEPPQSVSEQGAEVGTLAFDFEL